MDNITTYRFIKRGLSREGKSHPSEVLAQTTNEIDVVVHRLK